MVGLTTLWSVPGVRVPGAGRCVLEGWTLMLPYIYALQGTTGLSQRAVTPSPLAWQVRFLRGAPFRLTRELVELALDKYVILSLGRKMRGRLGFESRPGVEPVWCSGQHTPWNFVRNGLTAMLGCGCGYTRIRNALRGWNPHSN